jgi:hypothetical protein
MRSEVACPSRLMQLLCGANYRAVFDQLAEARCSRPTISRAGDGRLPEQPPAIHSPICSPNARGIETLALL